MNWCTVCWHPGAEAQLGELWLTVADPRKVAAAVNEIDQLLRFQPASKGRCVLAGNLQPELVDVLLQRMGVIPEDVRLLQFGPVEVVFTAHESDAQTRIWVFALRGACLKKQQ